MAEFVVEFGKKGAAPNGGLDAPAFHRNHEAIWSAIAPFLSAQTGDVLEIGSGTGQHATTFAARTPQFTWWPSDIYPSHLASIEAWRRHTGLANVRAPQRIDLTDPAWAWTADGLSEPRLAAMLCINVLHISPWTVAQNLIAGAGRYLARRRPAVRLWPVHARRRAHGAEQRRLRSEDCGRKIPHGACATSPISIRWRKTQV